MPDIALTSTPLTETAADAVVAVTFEDDLSEPVGRLDQALGGAITEMRSVKEFTGAFAQRPMLRTLGRMAAPRAMVLGLGKAARLDTFRLRNAFQFAGASLRGAGVHHVAVEIDEALGASLGLDSGAVARLAVIGLLTGSWDGGLTKTKDRELAAARRLERIELVGLDGATAETAIREAQVLAEATNQVRTWVATPSNRMTPTMLAAEAERWLEGTGVEVEVLRRDDLERLGMGALLGVAQGSDEPPVMICARWDGGAADGPRLALVGKGITFDTGGISIKPAGGMEMMKTDMGGGAAVLGAVGAIARLGIAANVIAVVPATENMPSGRAYKPGDVLQSRSGITIEVLNTDAEGRIILADGLARAREMGATHLVDVATLTGAIVVALGHVTTGMFANDAGLADRVRAASAVAGDRVTELPMHPEYDVCLESEVADIKNVGGREAGSISAAVFLREFVDDLPWVHLDIAGTAWNEQGDLKSVIPGGPSGTPVRTFVELARSFAAR